MSDIDTIEDIYESVGDVVRWQRLDDHLASSAALSPEVAWHLSIGRKAHERQLRVNEEISTFMAVHDQLTLGAIVVDEQARILGVNAVASRHLAEQTTLKQVGERLEAVAVADDLALSEAIGQASCVTNTPASRSPFIVLIREGRPPLCVVVVPGSHQSNGVSQKIRTVALLLVDPELTTPPGTDVLRALFGLTAREAELTSILMTGSSIEEAARALGIAITTARTFLAHITAKTESHSQPELMQRLLAIPNVR